MDYTYFVLTDDEGEALERDIQRYVQSGDLRSFFNLIEDIEPYGPLDRVGPGLTKSIEDFDGNSDPGL